MRTGYQMGAERVERRLAAILAADVAGYSRLMGADEEGTHAALTALRREVSAPKMAEHHGRIVKTTGDGLLAEFASVLDAVRCAVELQREMALRNHGVPKERRIEFRIGINLGDIIIDQHDIYGDGVNVAARLEALAEPGGICVAGIVYEQVRDRLDVAFEDVGEQQFKNIARPVRTYRVRLDGATRGAALAPADRRRVPRWAIAASLAVGVALATGTIAVWRAFWAPPAAITVAVPPVPAAPQGKPSIAVLPFANLSGDKAQDYLAEGLTENLIDTLAQNPGLFVIAHKATSVYRDKTALPQAVAKDLAVRYVLEGSVQKSGDRIRVTAQLTDAATDNHLLSQKYDRSLTDLFTLEDDLTLQIAGVLDAQFTGTVSARIAARGTRNLKAWEAAVKAFQAFQRFTPADLDEARKLAQRAILFPPKIIHLSKMSICQEK